MDPSKLYIVARHFMKDCYLLNNIQDHLNQNGGAERIAVLIPMQDKAKFEDNCRAIVGNQSYVLFTLDKLIYKLIKQLQIVSDDELDNKLLQLYDYEMSRKPDKFVDSVYYENAHVVLHEENIYHFESSSSPMSLSIQLVNEGNEKTDIVSVAMDPNFAAYLYNDYLSVSRGKKESSAVILKRNMRRYATLEESDAPCMATENVVMVNGLECKMAAFSSKISYVLDTEDFFCRFKRKKRASTSGSSWWNQAKVQHFREFLATNL
ncbi:chromatin/chromatin-binding, or -regulatory protein [Lithospermum erythrorhizon]|uniref:Chromatin/chromatin-binding, or -regulatory protein n=1 Tax=Lithospermum erythrorhizon TaxID=34254 RepID=A0AAV3RY35_LITER